MRFDKRFCARTAVTAGLLAAAVSVFGLSPVHAQTTPAMPAAAQQGPVRRMSIDDAVATALEQNLDLQVQRINPQLQDLSIAQFKAAYTPNFVSTRQHRRIRRSRRRASCPAARTPASPAAASIFNFGVSSLTSWYGGSYDVRWNNARNTTNNVFSSFNPQLNSSISATYIAAAAAQLQDRRHAPAAAGQPEEQGDHRLAAAAVDRADDAQRAQRLLRPDVRDRQPRRAAPVAAAVAAVAEGQPRPRRDRHHGAARHRPGRGRSGDARRSR